MKNIIKNNLKKNSIQILALFVMFLILASPVFAEEISAESILKYVNKSRASQGLVPLTMNDKLTKVAQGKLNDMIENKYFAHTSPDGKNPWYWFVKNSYDYQYAGENLAINFLGAEDQHKAWMDSPTHRKNILNANFLETGIAVGAGEIDGQVSIIAVQEFGTLVGVNPLEGGKSFSVKKDSNLLKDNGKIVPQVLSVKNEKSEGALPENKNNQNILENFFKYLKDNKAAISDFASTASAMLLMISLVLVPMVFLSMATDNLISIYERKEM